MSPTSALAAIAVSLAFAGPLAPTAFAQLVPPAGSAGAGNSSISGVPSGPANPSVLSDPSGIGNASRIPPLGRNPPTPVVSPPPPVSSPSRVMAPYAGASQRITRENRVNSRRPQFRRRSQPQVSKF